MNNMLTSEDEEILFEDTIMFSRWSREDSKPLKMRVIRSIRQIAKIVRKDKSKMRLLQYYAKSSHEFERYIRESKLRGSSVN